MQTCVRSPPSFYMHLVKNGSVMLVPGRASLARRLSQRLGLSRSSSQRLLRAFQVLLVMTLIIVPRPLTLVAIGELSERISLTLTTRHSFYGSQIIMDMIMM